MIRSMPLMQSAELHWIQNMSCPLMYLNAIYKTNVKLKRKCLLSIISAAKYFNKNSWYGLLFFPFLCLILSLSLSTLLLNTDWIINWLGLSDIQQCFRPPYLYTLIFTSDLMFKKKIFVWFIQKRVHSNKAAVVSMGDKAETLIRLFFFSKHHFVRTHSKR